MIDDAAKELIYMPDGIKTEYMKKVEEALGFQLFVWQWLYITQDCSFYGRRTGKTFACCLKALLKEYHSSPIKLTKRPQKVSEGFVRNMLFELKEKLDNAGISTNEIQFVNCDYCYVWQGE